MSEFEGLGPDAAHAWRHNNLGRLLHFAVAAFESEMLAGYHAAGFTDVRQVYLNALRHIDYRGGTRIEAEFEQIVSANNYGRLRDDLLALRTAISGAEKDGR